MHCTSARTQTTRPSHATQARMQIILSTLSNSLASKAAGPWNYLTGFTMGAIVQRSFSMARATKEVPCFRARLIHPGTLFDVNKSQSYFNFTVTCYLTRHVVVLQTRSFHPDKHASCRFPFTCWRLTSAMALLRLVPPGGVACVNGFIEGRRSVHVTASWKAL